MLEVSNLTVRYGQHRALDDAAIRVGRAEIVVILGANGAGKSTLLKAASGICEGQVTGSVVLDGTELTGMPANRIVDEGLALVPEGRGVFGDLTVRENLTLGAYSARARDEEAANLDRVYSLFPKLAERGRQVVRTMSGGEQQMVAIGRAMMSNPKVLTLDEPSLGLSPLLSKELFQNLRKVRDLGLGVLLVEQNAKQSLAIADRGYLLENAHIVHEDNAAALMTDPAVQAAYLGAAGATAPRSHDQPGPAPDMAQPDTQPAFEVRPRSLRTQSADTLLGRSVSDLVASASARSAETVHAVRSMAPAPEAAGSDRLASTLAGIEQAAQSARRARPARAPLPERPALAAAPSAPAQRPELGPVPVVDVYRAPRVEVYRRRDGGSEFERS
ncbi:ABC transporter ATP-binding protein [Anianabacter salinae]|uniref:ABC transporter ATP-binding protein n=1 Tax=Anianabacter salinae TaxID=2851023 RepID=UPI00225E3CBA|nr:ABC transporter ATP-binding protein [Anianabacter salinae]MBV0910909.1 ABC transporter ATP-binding protein [Anianabacter salinae]